MKIYLDLLIILNTLFDYVLLNSVNFILRRNVSYYRIVLASLLGNVSLLLLLVSNSSILVVSKVLLAFVVNLVCFGYRDVRYLLKNVIYFYLVSMLLGGVIYFFDLQFSFGDNGVVTNDCNAINYLLVIVFGIGVLYFYLYKVRDLKNNYNNYYSCLIYLDDDNSIKLSGFLDTGNKLKDPYTNKNIVLINKKVIANFKVHSMIYVPYNSLNNHGLLKCFKVRKIVIDGKESTDFLVGISEEEMFIDGIDCILNTSLMEGLK